MTRRLLLTLLVMAAFGAATVSGTYAAFSGTTVSAANEFDAGSVAVSDGHTATTPIDITDLRPGTPVAKCIDVTYDGTLPADLRQYVSTSGSLIPHLQLKVTRGGGLTGAWPTCTGFGADGTDYIGQGDGVVYDGALSSFPTSSGSATTDPTDAAPETWTTSESHAYQYEISLTNDPAAQALSGSVTITWEAQNL